MWFNAVVQMVSWAIHCLVVHYHCNDAIHNANVMNQVNIVLKSVQLMNNVHVVKFASLKNVETDVIQEIVLKVNYVKMELVFLVAETI